MISISECLFFGEVPRKIIILTPPLAISLCNYQWVNSSSTSEISEFRSSMTVGVNWLQCLFVSCVVVSFIDSPLSVSHESGSAVTFTIIEGGACRRETGKRHLRICLSWKKANLIDREGIDHHFDFLCYLCLCHYHLFFLFSFLFFSLLARFLMPIATHPCHSQLLYCIPMCLHMSCNSIKDTTQIKCQKLDEKPSWDLLYFGSN